MLFPRRPPIQGHQPGKDNITSVTAAHNSLLKSDFCVVCTDNWNQQYLLIMGYFFFL